MLRLLSLCLVCLMPLVAVAEEKLDPKKVAAWLEQPILEPETTLKEAQAYCRSKVRPWAEVTSVEQWEKMRDQMRADVLKHVVFRGEAAKWRDAKLGVEYLDKIEGGPGYSIQKLKYEALPGLWIPALLYVPDKLDGKAAVALHVNGHDRKGKAADYKQLRCIHLAKQGMIVLNTEWLGMGQLYLPNFGHYKMNQLDLCGTSGLAPFYLAMSRGLDVLLSHPNADDKRVAVAGLSGGGWQTIIISSLDERVTLSNPVAGYSSFLTRIGVSNDLGDSEQTPVDLAKYADYFHLTALRAPRPTLLTYNAKDECCFVAGSALPPLLEVAQPLYKLYGKPDFLRSHVNEDPGTHNFGLDNRLAYYRMVGDHFFADQKFSAEEDEELLKKEVKTAEELMVPLPEDNLDFNSLAKKLAEGLPRKTDGLKRGDWRKHLLKEILRWPFEVGVIDAGTTETIDGVKITRRTMILNENWSTPIVELTRGDPKSTTLVIADAGRRSIYESVTKLLEQGERVVAIDPFYFGECSLGKQDFLYGLLLSTVGDRPLGIQAAQVSTVASHYGFREKMRFRVETFGPRTSLVALCAAVDSIFIKDLVTHDAFTSLKDILTQNKAVNEAPELFTFGLLEFTDIPQLKELLKK